MPHEILITNNTTLKRFETEVKGEFAYVEYGHYRQSLVLIHTFVPVSARGEGIAIKLAKYVLDHAAKNNMHIVPLCPVIAQYIKLHPEYEVLIDHSYPYKEKF